MLGMHPLSRKLARRGKGTPSSPSTIAFGLIKFPKLIPLDSQQLYLAKVEKSLVSR